MLFRSLPFMGCTERDIGLLRAKVARLSIAGEMGFEINVPAVEHASLRETLLAAGAGLGLAEVGYYAMNSLRLEKSFGIWSREFTQGYTPAMTGLDRWIAYDKPNFIGRDAVLRARGAGSPDKVLATIEVDAAGADASGHEPVWLNGKKVGFATSGGYGHSIGTSLALALMAREAAVPGTEVTIHIVGVERSARVIGNSPYDPQGRMMRS